MLSKAKMVMKESLQKLHEGVATVIVRRSEKNPITKVEEVKESELYSAISCRLSFGGTKNEAEHLAVNTSGSMTLFVGPEIVIPENSKILVTQHGIQFSLTNGKIKPYSTHNEYEVSFFERWI